MITLLWMVLVSAAVACLAGRVLAGVIAPTVGQLDAPQKRRLGFELAAFLPLAVGGVAALALVALATSKALGWVVDHCVVHGTTHHPHLCLEHLPAIAVMWWSWLPVVLVSLPVAVNLIRQVVHQLGSARHVRMLMALSDGKGLARFVDNATPGAFVAGVRRPRIFFSKAFLIALNHRERRIVAAHEAAHLRARDPLRRLFLEACLTFHSGKTARLIRSGWAQAAEECADAAVASRFGPIDTALALVRVMRLTDKRDMGTALGIAGASVLDRITRLQSWDNSKASTHPMIGVFFVGISMLAASILLFHHPIETALGMLIGH